MTEREIRHNLATKLVPLPQAKREWYRAESSCLCECGHEYRLHPLDPEDLDYQGNPFMHVICNGNRVKL